MSQFRDCLKKVLVLVHFPLVHETRLLQLAVQLSVMPSPHSHLRENAHQRVFAHLVHCLLVDHHPFGLVDVASHMALQIQVLVTRHAVDHLLINSDSHSYRFHGIHDSATLICVLHNALQFADVAFH